MHPPAGGAANVSSGMIPSPKWADIALANARGEAGNFDWSPCAIALNRLAPRSLPGWCEKGRPPLTSQDLPYNHGCPRRPRPTHLAQHRMLDCDSLAARAITVLRVARASAEAADRELVAGHDLRAASPA